jgi:hypothetical protein
LDSLLDVNNDNSIEIRKRILLANKCFYGVKRQFRSQFLSIKNKVKLYKTLIRPVLAHGAETWVLSKSDENILKVFERKILRAIFGPTNEQGEWTIKHNNELYALYKESDIVTHIKINRLRWAGHIRLEEQNPARRVLVAVVEGRRQRGRPKLRWKVGVKEDARKLWGEKLEECCKEQGQLVEASKEGLGSEWAVVPMMMTMKLAT